MSTKTPSHTCKERSEDFPGIEIVEQWKRVYPYAPLASHVVGYLGPITKETVNKYKAKNYNTNELVGAFGVEASMEDTLHGRGARRSSKSTPRAASFASCSTSTSTPWRAATCS